MSLLHHAPFVALAAVSICVVACEPKPPSDATVQPASSAPTTATSARPSADAATCKNLGQAARAKATARIEQSRACTADSDCTTVAVATRCFDMCTRPIATAQKSAVQSALGDADAACADFLAAGCKLVVPPCVPPPETTCREGKCTQ